MTRGRRRRGPSTLAGLVLIGTGLAVPAMPAAAAVPNDLGVVIHEVYGGGGNAGATYTHDFIELYNTTDDDVDLAGWSVQYRSATGTPDFINVTPLTGTIPANGHYLVQQAAGTGGTTPLPAPDDTGDAAMQSSNVVVALASTTTTLSCAAGATACAALPEVVDLVGTGTAGTYLVAAAPAMDNTTSAQRSTPTTNTWDNAADFETAAPSPTNSAGDTEAPDPIELSIAEIQGTDFSSPYEGDLVITEGVVTAHYPTGGFEAYVIQTPGTGGDITLEGRVASDGIWVASSATVDQVEIGDYVEVSGTVSEEFGLTTLNVPGDGLTVLTDAFDPPAAITAPWPADALSRESIESMLFTPTGTYTVSNTYPTNQFGEVGLAVGNAPLVQPTDRARPGTAEADAVAADNAARGVILDDGASTNYLSGANRDLVPPYVSLDDPVRVGATATFNHDVIVHFAFGNWRFQPPAPITAETPIEERTAFSNTRTAAPDDVGGDVVVAAFNVLNYFITLGEDVDGCEAWTDRAGNPINVRTGCLPRGAWDAENLARQQIKIVEAIVAMDADVIGLMEIENSARLGQPPDAAAAALVDALNATEGSEVWDYVESPVGLPPLGLQDVITNAIIYKPAAVTPVGPSVAPGDVSDIGQPYDNAREPIGQTFEPSDGGAPFFVAVNHFKSKSAGDDATGGNEDQGDGQGWWNADRVEQAEVLLDWAEDVAPTDDILLIGDFNSYSHEDPMYVFYDAGYVNVNIEAGLVDATYNFGGMNGSLDHVVASRSVWERVTGSDIWTINAPESVALEYSRYNNHGALFHAPDAYRSSDHDPVLVGLVAGDPDPDPEPEGAIVPVAPGRVLDTRSADATVDGTGGGAGFQPAGSVLRLPVAGRAGVPADAAGVVLNLTIANGDGTGYATVWPCDASQPYASNANFVAGDAAPNTLIAALSATGEVCIYLGDGGAHLIADVTGYVPADSEYQVLNPARLADSRPGLETVDGEHIGTGRIEAGTVWEIPVAGRGGVPADARAAMLNVTVGDATGEGYVTVWPCDGDAPYTSTSNFAEGTVTPNGYLGLLSPSGTVCVLVAESATQVIVDVNGYVVDADAIGALRPARLADTRPGLESVDGEFVGQGRLEVGEVLELAVARRGGVPEDATGAVLNVTVGGADDGGYVTMWPCDGPPPYASIANFTAGAVAPNMAVAALSDAGTVCFTAGQAPVHVIVDVTGHL